MSFQSTISALAASIAFAAAAQTPPARVEWLPMFGPVEEKACNNIPIPGLRPGVLLPVPPHQKGKYIWAIGNTCEYNGFKVDSETGLPTELVSRSEMIGDGIRPMQVQLAGTTLLKEGWWREGGILNQQPQTVSISPDKNATCQVKVGNTAPIRLAYNTVIIPDSTQAYYIKPGCQLELMIKMPAQTTTVSGSGVRNPGNISLPPPATTPAGNYINTSGFSDPIIGALFNLLGKYTDLIPAYRKDNCVILTYGMDKADTTRRAHNLTPEQAAMAAPAFANETPTSKAARCRKQWEEAYSICRGLLDSPNPPRGQTGGHQDMYGCMKGYVNQSCQGNKIEWGAKGPPAGWRPEP